MNYTVTFTLVMINVFFNTSVRDISVLMVLYYISMSRPPSVCSLFSSCSYLHSSHEIVLRRSHPGSWGFSIVGGYEETHGNQAFFIKTIVLGTPAYYDGRLK